jgi:4'-phosphopantetheinyl transferase
MVLTNADRLYGGRGSGAVTKEHFQHRLTSTVSFRSWSVQDVCRHLESPGGAALLTICCRPAIAFVRDARARCSTLRCGASKNNFEREPQQSPRARATVQEIAAAFFNAPSSAVRFERSAHGKPALRVAGVPSILEFNVSHSVGISLVGLTTVGPIGVDIERRRHVVEADRIVRQFCSPAERQAFQRLDQSERAEAFIPWWTRKEAFVKGLGRVMLPPLSWCSLNPDPKSPASLLDLRAVGEDSRNWVVQDIRVPDGYRAAMAVRGSASGTGCAVSQRAFQL